MRTSFVYLFVLLLSLSLWAEPDQFIARSGTGLSTYFSKFKAQNFQCEKIAAREDLKGQKEKIKELIRLCLKDYGQYQLMKESKSAAVELYQGQMTKFSDNYGVDVEGVPLNIRFRFEFPEKVRNLGQNVVQGGHCLSDAALGVHGQDIKTEAIQSSVENYKKQIDAYTELLAYLHSQTLGKEMGLLFHIYTIQLCHQNALKDVAEGYREMVISDGSLLASLNPGRGDTFNLEYLIEQWSSGKALRHITESADIAKYIRDKDITIPVPYYPDWAEGSWSNEVASRLAAESDLRMLAMKENGDLIGIGIEKLAPYWVVFDYGGEVRTKIRKKIYRAISRSFLKVKTSLAANDIDPHSDLATQAKFNHMYVSSKSRGFSEEIREYLEAQKSNPDKVNELYDRWKSRISSGGFVSNILDAAILAEDNEGSSFSMDMKSAFSLVARNMQCTINVANIHGIRVNAALLSGIRDKMNIGRFDGSIDDDRDAEILAALREQNPDATVEVIDNKVHFELHEVTMDDGDIERKRSIVFDAPLQELRSYNMNFDFQEGFTCVDTEDQIEVDAVIEVLGSRLSQIKPSSVQAMALFDVLYEDKNFGLELR